MLSSLRTCTLCTSGKSQLLHAAWLSTWSDDQWPPESSACTHHPERGREHLRDRKTKNVAHKKMWAPPGRASATRPRLRHPAAPPHPAAPSPPGRASATRSRLRHPAGGLPDRSDSSQIDGKRILDRLVHLLRRPIINISILVIL